MREIEQIADFSKGVITSVDAADIPSESCVLATNIEPNEGYVVPVKEPSTHTSTANRGLAIKDYTFAVKDATTKSIVCQDDTKIKYGTYSTASPFGTDLIELGTYTSTDLIPYNRDVRIGSDGSTPKIFKHSDFQFLGMREFSYALSKWNIDFGSDYNKLIFFRGTPSADMTVYVPLFAVDSQGTSDLTVSGVYANEEKIVQAIDDYVDTKSLAVFYDNNTIGTFTITDITNLTITISGTLARTVLTCFVYAGISYNDNPMVVTKIGTTYKAFNCPGASDAYTSIENGMFVKLAGAYNTSSGTISLDRRLNFIANISVAPIYEDDSLSTYADDTDTKVKLSVASSGSSGYFKVGTGYVWTWTFTYDGNEESILSYRTCTDTPIGEKSTMTLTIDIKDFTALSRRITGINLYRKEIKDGISTFNRLIKRFDLTQKDTGVPNSWLDKTNNWIYLTYADTGAWGASYESITGLPEDVQILTPQYKYGIIANNRLYTVGNVVSGEDEMSKTLLMSEPFRFDIFNWDENNIILPSTPKAIGYFRDKLYVFGDNVIWKCNPDILTIEDSYYGYQLLHNRSMLATDFGLIFAATTGIYVLDGTNVTELSYPIRDTNGVNSGIRSSCKSWSYSITNNRVFIYYMHSKNQILFFDTYTETGWVYHIRYKSWWYLDFGASSTLTNSCLITDEVANIFWSTGTAIKKMFAGTNYAGATWISKLFTNSTASQKKRLYFIKHESENYLSNLTAYVDNAGSSTLTSDSAGNVTDTTYKSLQLKWANVASSTKRTIKDIEMVFRRMKGVR